MKIRQQVTFLPKKERGEELQNFLRNLDLWLSHPEVKKWSIGICKKIQEAKDLASKNNIPFGKVAYCPDQ